MRAGQRPQRGREDVGSYRSGWKLDPAARAEPSGAAYRRDGGAVVLHHQAPSVPRQLVARLSQVKGAQGRLGDRALKRLARGAAHQVAEEDERFGTGIDYAGLLGVIVSPSASSRVCATPMASWAACSSAQQITKSSAYRR